MQGQDPTEHGIKQSDFGLGGEHSLRVYEELARAYEQKNANQFAAICLADEGHIKFDRNEGIVKHLSKSLEQKRVSDLSQVYITLSFNDINAKAQLNQKEAQIEDLIVEMASTGKAKALVNRKDKTVNFDDTELQE